MAERIATYSRIITPEEYNRIISKEHLYISASDRAIKEFVEKYRPKNRIAEVVEIGCGPARVLPLIATVSDLNLMGIDHDEGFLNYARTVIKEGCVNASVVKSDISTWQHSQPVDIFYSQGVHHHIGKSHDLREYLNNVRRQLAAEGVYILSDEFLPEYTDEVHRQLKAVIWYSHIITSAKRLKYDYLAQEEAKTLLDDLYEGEEHHDDVKTEEQIRLVLEHCTNIDQAALLGEIAQAEKLAEKFLNSLSNIRNIETHGDITTDLSRGDFKICESVFRAEVEQAGFEIVERKTVGPVDSIGGMAVYVLRVR
jgi:cyclopropane fatty-acyl-phospholipid synthase-like methyltransferase